MDPFDNMGIGADIEDVARFRALDPQQHRSFLEKIFSREELDYCFSKDAAAEHLAARYAGKEAVVKALGAVRHGAPQYNDIEITNGENGVPLVKMHDPAFQGFRFNITLSHCSDKAIAVATAVKRI